MITLRLTGGRTMFMRSPLDGQEDWSVTIYDPQEGTSERRFTTPAAQVVRSFSAGTLQAWLYNNFPQNWKWVQFNWTDIKPKWLELVDTYLAATNPPKEDTNP